MEIFGNTTAPKENMSQRIKFIQDYENNKAGDITVVDNNIAHGLIEAGVAVITKDMTSRDYSTRKPSKIAVRKRGKASKWQL